MNTPVLLLAFNRPKKTKRVLSRLQELGVRHVYISADGAKTSKDQALLNEVKSVTKAFNSIVKNSQFLSANLGCKKGVLSGIDWFFNQVEEGIILEDDCLPNASFFNFCETLLSKHRNNFEVGMISGNNPLGYWHSEAHYFFSRIGHVWGWATWKNRWSSFNSELPKFQEFVTNSGFERAFGPTLLAQSRKELTERSIIGKIDTWDYQWNAHLLMSDALAAVPRMNLVENIGFDDSATHTKSKPDWISFATQDLDVLETEERVIPNREYEMDLFLAQKANKPATPNADFFQQLGRKEASPLNIAIINSTDLGGGAEKIAFQLHQQLLQKGHGSTLLVSTKKSGLNTVVELNQDWKEQISDLEPNIIHVHNLHGTPIPLNGLAELSFQFKVLFTLHDSWLTTGSSNHPFKLDSDGLSYLETKDWKSELANRNSAIIDSKIRFTAPSQWMRERFYIKHKTIPFYAPNCVDKSEQVQFKIPSNRFVVFVANKPETNPYKDFKTLKLAWTKANETLGDRGVDLICIGCESNSMEKIGNHKFYRIERLDLSKVNSFLAASLLVIQASKQDNAPLGILEAHSKEKIVLASMVGGIPELLTAQERDWMYKTGNELDLCNKLVTAILGGDGENEVYTKNPHTTLEDMINLYIGHYRDLLHG